MTDTTEPQPEEHAPDEEAPPGEPAEPLLVRPRDGRMIAGVCAGIAKRWNLDITLVRILTVALTLVSGIGLAVYVAAWLLTPSTDQPAPLRAGSRGARLASRVPALVLIVLVALVLAGTAHALWWGAPVGLLVAALVVALVLGTRKGRWFLVTVAALLAVGLATVGAFGSHFGTRSYHVSSLADLRHSYEYGAGNVHLDLADLAVTGRHRTKVRLGRGDVTVTVPSDVAVFVHARAGVGSVTIDGHKVGGFDAEQAQLVGSGTDSDVDRLMVDVVVGAGSVDIRTA